MSIINTQIHMKIQFNTDKNIEGHQRLETYFSAELEKELSRFEEKITRLEVHLGDENSDKNGAKDKRCVIEARPAGMQPIAVTAHANAIEKAVFEATAKIKKILTTTFEKQLAF